MTDLSKKFVTQGELDERRQKRQEEWEKKRGPSDPLECPEEVVDNRSLYERLQEQKEKKELEFQESISFKNEVKGLQEDEAQFLDYVSQREIELTKARNSEEARIIKEMKESSVIKLDPGKSEKDERKPAKAQIGASQNKKSQQALLAGVVKRKSTDSRDNAKKLKKEEGIGSHMAAQQNRNNSSLTDLSKTSDNSKDSSASTSQNSESADQNFANNVSRNNQTAKIIGILPGLGAYDNDTSDSETSSSDSDVDFRLAPPKKLNVTIENS